jgi:NAD(P)-dependent dehydrogenase (short-subunit alcohol dehydrogenase family)
VTARLQGKVALVTGSGHGIGRAIALRFAADGAKVVVMDRNEEGTRETCESINAVGNVCIGLTCDLKDEHQVQEMVKSAADQWGAIDILVNNAAVFPERIGFQDVTFQQWSEVIDVNLFGVVRCTQAVVSVMVRNKTPGRIINISSLNAFRYRRGTYGQSQYNVSKAAVDNLTKGLAMELAPHGIVVNAIAPGFVRTSMSSADSLDEPHFRKEYLESGRIPLGRYGTPDDCAKLAVFLASEECTWITGETILQDGGMHITF